MTGNAGDLALVGLALFACMVPVALVVIGIPVALIVWVRRRVPATPEGGIAPTGMGLDRDGHPIEGPPGPGSGGGAPGR
jgi:hypothetical protein